MMKPTFYSTLLGLFFTSILFAQEMGPDLVLTPRDSIVKSAWVFGIGLNAVDDSGDDFDELLSFNNQWNIVPFPSRLNFGRIFANGFTVEAIATYNKYKEGKEIDQVFLTEDINYYGLDSRVTYSLNKLWGGSKWFDPYLGGGVGYTDANNVGRGTWNGVFGFRFWFSDRFGVDINSMGKWAMNRDKATNHLQHGVSGLYRFGINKGLTRKGEEKLAMIREFEAEQKRVNDSIAAVKQAEEEARLLAEELAKKEAERLAAQEAARKEAERKAAIEKEIRDYGNIYFAFNSSYLNNDSKVILDKVAGFMERNPSVKLRITSHTDARGAESYNQWLSDRRVTRTVDYLIDKGVSEGRLESQGLGESHLANECDDHTSCPEEKHKENRRSEFLVIEL
ncbi:hypothetical protein B7P33_18335 [Sediminicola luteus]|uniref:OmpA-like domain-containing protein n=2 Tax=Sediminicola luteus TaxID=319238 RepID=A0A2A4G4N5_9FLAO|nr:hypothetical protein B7P33_18335 [Sediminicola luteus]